MAGSGDGNAEMSRLQGILRWSIEQQPAQQDENRTETAATGVMSEERREFLRSALAGMQNAPTEADMMKTNLAIVDRVTASIGEPSSLDNQVHEELVERGTEALEALCDMCENIDNANDMIPLGGFPVIEKAADATESSLQTAAFELLGNLFQNNPRCQQHGLECNVLSKCIHHLDCSQVVGVRVKALYATSCLVKDNHPAQAAFVEQDGYSALCRCLKSGVEKITTKAAFLVANMVAHSASNTEFVLKSGVLDQLLALLSSNRTQSLEHVARTVSYLIDVDGSCLKAACEHHSHLATSMEATIVALKRLEDDQYQVGIHYSQSF
eukprot:scpid82255/ scgid2637/ Hsp70-binding protein 1; Heat shock protein-binding protein 1; Hsp70-interacting protein 1